MTAGPTGWRAPHRTDITFSLPVRDDADRATMAAWTANQPFGGGGTVIECTGWWQGSAEHARRIELVGADCEGAQVRAIVGALHDAGCDAVQVEEHGRNYHAREWRAEGS